MKELLELEHVNEAYNRYITKLELKENENTFMLFLKDFLFYYYKSITEINIIEIKTKNYGVLVCFSSNINNSHSYIFMKKSAFNDSTYEVTINTLKEFLNHYEL